MANDKFKILLRKDDCVLLSRTIGSDVKYIVRDIENDVIFMSFNDYAKAKQAFDKFDLNRIRQDRKKLFDEWLEEFAEE